MLKDYLQLHFVVLILGFTAILGRLVEVDIYTLVLLRTGLASMGMALIIYARKTSFKVQGKDLRLLFLMGCVIAIHWLCFFGSARLATVSISLIAYSTTSFFTSIIEPLYHRRKPSYFEMLLGLFVVIGIACIFSFDPQYKLGLAVGLIGALLASVFTIMNTELIKGLKATVINFYELLAAFGFMILFISMTFLTESASVEVIMPNKNDWLWVLLLAFGCTLYPYLKILDLLKRFSAFTINLSVTMEPVYGILLVLLFFGDKEKISSGFYIGAGVILANLLMHFLHTRHKKSLAARQQG